MAEVAVPKVGDTKTNPKTGEIATFTGEGWEISPRQPVFGEDFLRSAVGGLEHGAAQFIGLPFSMADLAAQGLGAAAKATVGEGALTKGFENIRRDVAPITGSALEKTGNKYVPGMNYQPQGTAGEWAHTAGEWAPSIAGAAIGGGIPAATKAIVSALGSEGLGQLAHAYTPDWETPARIIGALTGWRAPTTAGKIVEKATAPAASRVEEVTKKLAEYDKKYKPTQAKPNEYWELKKEQASNPAYTAPAPGAAEAPKTWADTIAGPLGYGAGALASHYLFPGNPGAELAAVLGGGQLAGSVPKMVGAGTKGAANILSQEVGQAPGVVSWMAGSRGIPYLDAQLQQGQP